MPYAGKYGWPQPTDNEVARALNILATQSHLESYWYEPYSWRLAWRMEGVGYYSTSDAYARFGAKIKTHDEGWYDLGWMIDRPVDIRLRRQLYAPLNAINKGLLTQPIPRVRAWSISEL